MTNIEILNTAIVVLAIFCVGCTESPGPQSESPDGTAWKVVAEDQLDAEQASQRDRAMAARDELFEKLKSRLTEVVGTSGPADAIKVCNQEAFQMAQQVGDAHQVSMGRTSFRLRNSGNRPPKWAQSQVEKRVESPVFLARGHELAALLPIRMKAQCLTCHGDPKSIPAPVQAALTKFYPRDAATGFAEGDLRGWFWVEVPAAAANQSLPASKS